MMVHWPRASEIDIVLSLYNTDVVESNSGCTVSLSIPICIMVNRINDALLSLPDVP